MALKLYVDLMSQPCRALVIFMKMSDIQFSQIPVALRKGEHAQEAYLKINPLGKVPTLVDGTFALTERYLSEKYTIPDALYPKEIEKRAKVDEYLEWQHLNTRYKAAKVFISEVLLQKDPTELVAAMNAMLDELDKMFLRDNKFLTGNLLSFADVLAACELIQPSISGRDVFESRPKLKSWMERVKSETQPYFDDAHKILYKSRESVMKRRSNM